MAHMLDGHSRESFTPWNRKASDKLMMPLFITSESDLRTLRTTLAVFFGAEPGKANAKARKVASDSKYAISYEKYPLFSTPIGVRLLCLEMLVEPVFDAEERCTGFTALDPDKAAEEFAA